jgi:hypothetical protein
MVPRIAQRLLDAGVPEADVERLVWDNPIDFYAKSGRLDRRALEGPPGHEPRETFEGNSVLRGQDPARL